MSKRPYLNIEDDEYQDEVGEIEELNRIGGTSTNAAILLGLLRMVLSRQSRNQKVRKEHFAPILHRHNLKGNVKPWILLLQMELKNLFGFDLQPIGNELVVTNSLEPDSKNLLAILLESNNQDTHDGYSIHDPLYLLPRHQRSISTVSTTEMVLGGVIVLVICILVSNENRMRELNLLDALNGFGLSENLNVQVASLNKNTQEIVTELVRREYIERVSNSSVSQNFEVEICLGKRSMREFEPQMIFSFMQQLFDQEEMQRKCIKTIQRCFPGWSPSEDLYEG